MGDAESGQFERSQRKRKGRKAGPSGRMSARSLEAERAEPVGGQERALFPRGAAQLREGRISATEPLWPTGGRDFPGLSFLAFSSDSGLVPYCPLGKGINVSVSCAQVPRPTYYTL